MVSKRQAKAQQELESLKAAQQALDDESGEEEVEMQAPKSAFASLASDDVEESSSSDPEPETSAVKTKKKNKKKKKKSTATTALVEEETPAVPVKKAKKLDEIDQALQDLGLDQTKAPAAARVHTQGTSSAPSLLRPLLSIETKHLDPDVELKRMFGSKIINSAAAQPATRGGRRVQPTSSARQRNFLAKPASHWAPVGSVKSGLSMEVMNDSVCPGGEAIYTFVHSNSYKECQSMFLQAVSASDVSALQALLYLHPYHLDTLLQLAEMSNQQGDAGQSDDFLNRAIHAFERAFAASFSLTNGSARLAFEKIENRGLFRALDRKITSLTKRGCWRTAFETTKVLLCLDPYSDPYASMLHLEFLAPKAQQGEWFLDLLETLPKAYAAANLPPDSILKFDTYPGIAFAKALIKFDLEEAGSSKKAEDVPHEGSEKELLKAILRFPFMVPVLCDQLGTKVPDVFRTDKRSALRTNFETKRPDSILHLLGHYYIHRSWNLYRPPEIMAWITKVVNQAAPLLGDSTNADVQFGQAMYSGEALYGEDIIPAGFLRHILAADVPTLRAHYPPGVLASIKFSYDPLPPMDATHYDEEYFSGVRRKNREPAQAGAEEGGWTRGNLLAQLQNPLGQNWAEADQAAVQEQVGILAEAIGQAPPGAYPGVQEDEDEDAVEGEEPNREPADAAGIRARLQQMFGQ